MNTRGYSLVEIMVATSILGVVSLLGFIVLASSNEAAQLTTAKVDVQNSLRDTMAALTSELREAVSADTTNITGAPEDLFPVAIADEGAAIVFQVPEPVDGEAQFTYSTPITFAVENEDDNGNGRLDPGEDGNEDGALTRRVIRVQDGEESGVASANAIDTAVFTLVQNQAADNDEFTTVNISLTGSKRYGPGEGKLVVAEMQANIRLVN